jgi:hypothetical protein
MFNSYGLPERRTIKPGAVAWPYTFPFTMPWGTKLDPPWYSGYANAAMAGAAACALALTGDKIFASVVREATAFLELPMAEGGAGYVVNGFPFIAEYVYPSPPIPNYRVLDGELGTAVFLYNAAVLTGDSALLDLVVRIGAGLPAALKLLRRPDGLPYFGMDGQPMNPSYMWQLWMTLQLLANIYKDRVFLAHAAEWRRGIPEEFVQRDYPV